MDIELKSLLSREKDTVLMARNERELTKEEQKKLREQRLIEKHIQDAKDKGIELNNFIANELIDIYVEMKENDLRKEPYKIDYFLDLKDVRDKDRMRETCSSDYERVMTVFSDEIDEYDQKIWKEFHSRSSSKIKDKFGDKKNLLAIWYYKNDNVYSIYESYDLTYFDKTFFEKQGIKVNTKGYYRILHLEFDRKSLDNFVQKVLSKRYVEITLDNDYLDRRKAELKEIEYDGMKIAGMREKSKSSAKIVALDVCKLAIKKYNQIQKYGEYRLPEDKSFQFELEAKISDWAIEYFGGEELKKIVRSYGYDGYIAAACHNKTGEKKYLPIIIDDLNEIIKDIGILGTVERSSKITFNVDVAKFEEAVLNADEDDDVKRR